MFLAEFTSTKIQREPGIVFDAAQKEPVIVTRSGHLPIIAMSKGEYARLVKAAAKENLNA